MVRVAERDEVGRVIDTARGAGDEVMNVEIGSIEPLPAVLARVVIASQDGLAHRPP
jgi:hypothetical protein